MRFRVYRDGQLVAITSGNEWTDNDANLDQSHEYFVQALDVINLASTTGAALSYEPAAGPVTIPVLPLAGTVMTGITLLIIALRRRA